ncbi:preprotein translocase subunit YajC [Formicincola oecophyllae]|uniref:Sec translocon accessory complex subunit YajC n=1 Tax=Formicincola oecophyllae TaxID=2558361 RepID=A0A4Y6UBN3_9PROT|nr:preprotein translocase subunit YajC [Formicincola oecophyllae]QDH13877.1 preprotein translocase subunit YajC [Formicincola oecophyllae]
MISFLATPAYAAGATTGGFDTGALMGYVPIILIFVVFYFLILRPQRVKQQQLRAQQAGLKRGDRIVTAGGVVGVVRNATEGAQDIDVEIAPNVRVKVLRSTINTVIPPEAPANDG